MWSVNGLTDATTFPVNSNATDATRLQCTQPSWTTQYGYWEQIRRSLEPDLVEYTAWQKRMDCRKGWERLVVQLTARVIETPIKTIRSLRSSENIGCVNFCKV